MATVVDVPDTLPPSPPAEPAVDSGRRLRLRVQSPYGYRLSFPAALLAVVLSGVCLLFAFPPFDQWWLAPVGVALFAGACHRRRIRGGIGLGMIAGLVFFAPLLSWTSTQVGEVPWVLLSFLEALYFALLGGLTACAGRLVDRHRALWPLVTGVLWVAQEALRGRTPFGGFPWGRLAFSQADSPLAQFAWLGGAPLVSFAVAAVGGLLLAALWRPALRGAVPLRKAGAFAGVAVLTVLVGLVEPTVLTAPAGPKLTVAVIQGSVPRLGLEFNAQRRAVLDNHVAATIALAEDVEDGVKKQPDVVVWPENASDIDPIAFEDAAKEVSRAAEAIGVPIVLGTIQKDSNGQNRNISLVWDPQTGAGFEYVKQHPVPFAEYIPMKPIVRTVAGWLDQRMVDGMDRVNGFVPGEEPGVIPVGDVTLSGIICFEVAYDDLVRESVTEGAQILAVQTNNATFNNAEATQQMAMVRLRSIEHGRAGLMASTVGVSGFTDASGAVHDLTVFDTQAVIVSELDLGEGTTPATALGMWPELAGCVLALGALVASVALRRGGKAVAASGASKQTTD